MALTAGSHHVAMLTSDMDRLIGFYERVFEGEVVLDMNEDGLRHTFIDLGGGFILHPFQIPGVEVPQGELTIFERGRLDHLALRAETARTSGSCASAFTARAPATARSPTWGRC
jgi:catechol 2,3-dioxygenase-like lactoylglutathione lyase family enzyme